ncbi:MAG: hypothetical protein ABIS50_15690 [Luteolibacter sp.]|uniref:hypothetical protein n=1 Tax=Luteolibacter sp. TaxID=1962973 RepID=UPI0032634210
MASSSMDEDPEKKRNGGVWLAVAVMLPVLYVLSMAPVVKFYSHRPPLVVVRIYRPVMWVYKRVHWTRKPLDAYLRLWNP